MAQIRTFWPLKGPLWFISLAILIPFSYVPGAQPRQQKSLKNCPSSTSRHEILGFQRGRDVWRDSVLADSKTVHEPARCKAPVALCIGVLVRFLSSGVGIILRVNPDRIEVRVHLYLCTFENSDFIKRPVSGRTRHNLAVLLTGLRSFGVEYVESTESGHVGILPRTPIERPSASRLTF